MSADRSRPSWLWPAPNAGTTPEPLRPIRCKNAAGVAIFVLFTVSLSLYYLTSAPLPLYLRTISVYGHRTHSTSRSPTDDKYLVDGRKCRIQDIDPYDEEVRAFIKTVPHIPCTKNPLLTYMLKRDGYSELHVDATVTRVYSPNGVRCCYSSITRVGNGSKPDDSIAISECQPFKDSVNTTDEFLIVKCATRNRKKQVYKNGHAVVNIRPDIRKRLRAAKHATPKPLSVLIVGVDSVSRLNGLRALSSTTGYLHTKGWIELRGYNKIADNTFPNLMAVLTGIEGDSAYDTCLPTQLYRLDNCSFIWRKFRQFGYVTGYAEDEANISTFNFHKVGFVNAPTDYYLRPFVMAAQRELKTVEKHSLKYCVGPVSAGERILDYAQDFAVTFVNHSSFGLFWTNSFSHNDLNTPSGMDAVLTRFFRRLHDTGVTSRSLVVFLSDHGMRFGDVRQTKIGWLEERLPLAWLSVPQWFKEKHPEAWNALEENTARLTTPYDFHMTLQHILEMASTEKKPYKQQQSTGCPKCQSLFKPIDPDRSCEDASISPHWCVCIAFRPVDHKSSLVKTAAHFVVSRINAYTREGSIAEAEKSRHKCAALTLSKILISQVGISWDGTTVYYLLFVETLPGRGKFEATISLAVNSTTAPSFQLHSSISRLDSYAGQSRCINNPFLKKYCYCR